MDQYKFYKYLKYFFYYFLVKLQFIKITLLLMKSSQNVSLVRQTQIKQDIQRIIKLILISKQLKQKQIDKQAFQADRINPKHFLLKKKLLNANKKEGQSSLIKIGNNQSKQFKQIVQNQITRLRYEELLYLLVYKKISIQAIKKYIQIKYCERITKRCRAKTQASQNRNEQITYQFDQISLNWLQIVKQQQIFNDVLDLLNKNISQQWKSEISKSPDLSNKLNTQNQKIKIISRRQCLQKINSVKQQMAQCQGQINMAKNDQTKIQNYADKYHKFYKKYNYWKEKYRNTKNQQLQPLNIDQINKQRSADHNTQSTPQLSPLIFAQNKHVATKQQSNKKMDKKINQILNEIKQLSIYQKKLQRLKSLQDNTYRQKIINSQTQSKAFSIKKASINQQDSIDMIQSRRFKKTFQSTKQKDLKLLKKIYQHYVKSQQNKIQINDDYRNSIDFIESQLKIKDNIFKGFNRRSIDNSHRKYSIHNQQELKQMKLQSYSKFIKDFQLYKPIIPNANTSSNILTTGEIMALFKEKSSNKKTIKYHQFIQLFQNIYRKQCEKLGVSFQPKLFDGFLRKQIFSYQKINKILRLKVQKNNRYQKSQFNQKSIPRFSINQNSSKKSQDRSFVNKNSSNTAVSPYFVGYSYQVLSHTGKLSHQIQQKINESKKQHNQMPCMNPQFRKSKNKRKQYLLRQNISLLDPINTKKKMSLDQNRMRDNIIRKQKIYNDQLISSNKKQKQLNRFRNSPSFKLTDLFAKTIDEGKNIQQNHKQVLQKQNLSYTKRFKNQQFQKRLQTLDISSFTDHNQQNQQQLSRSYQIQKKTIQKQKHKKEMQQKRNLQKLIGIISEDDEQDQYAQIYQQPDQDDTNQIYLTNYKQKNYLNKQKNYLNIQNNNLYTSKQSDNHKYQQQTRRQKKLKLKQVQKRQRQRQQLQDNAYLDSLNKRKIGKRYLVHF